MVSVVIRPRAINAISFDLDDTLYDNRPVMRNAERQLWAFLAQQYPKTQQWQAQDWQQLKQQLLLKSPLLAHDTTAARLVTLEQGLLMLGYDKKIATVGAKAGLDYFRYHRADFTVAPEVLAILHQLAARYPLVGITNGNVDAEQIGLGEVLAFVVHPGNGTRMKPYADMFYQAATRLALPTKLLLHVGDSYTADVQGARLAGCQAAWLNPAVGRDPQVAGSGLLPHLHLTALSDLLQLV